MGASTGCSPRSVEAESKEADRPTEQEDEEAESPTVSLGRGGDDAVLDSGDPDVIGVGGATHDGESEPCLRFMSWGAVATQGAVPGESGMDAIVAWLNDASTARGDHFADKPEITREFLDAYDLVLLQNLGRWQLTDEEIWTFRDWVHAGGSAMALSGYEGDTAQVMTTNRLLSFSGMNYVSLSEVGDTSTSLGVCGYCLGTTDRQEGWNPEHPIADGVSAVGAFGGRSIQGDGEIVAQEEGKVLGMTKEVELGRVFLFHDDWISYHVTWSQNAPGDCTQNIECSEVSPRGSYQTPRLWYNAFNWLVGGRECFYVGEDDDTE